VLMPTDGTPRRNNVTVEIALVCNSLQILELTRRHQPSTGVISGLSDKRK